MKLKQWILKSPSISNLEEVSEAKSQHSEFEGEAELRRTPRREWSPTSNFNDFRVDIPEFEGKLDPDKFLEWLHIVEWIFEYKEVPEDKKTEASCPHIEETCTSMMEEYLYQEN